MGGKFTENSYRKITKEDVEKINTRVVGLNLSLPSL
jgi:hypothetical protein